MMLLAALPDTKKQASAAAERRRGLRVAQNRPVKIQEPSSARFFGGRTADVSDTGLRLELPRHIPLRPGKLLHIHVGVNDSGQPLANRSQMIPARVVWVNRASDSTSRLLAGIEFVASLAFRDAA